LKSFGSLHAAKKRERGVVLLLGALCLPVIIAILGITVDLSIMYAIKGRLQMACDGAAVAALRSLNLANSISSQQTPAQHVATQWFNANFAGNFMGAQGTTLSTPVVAQNAATFVTSVTVSASTNSPSYFMKYYNFGATLIGASGQASRRNVVMTLVLDRSGSMNNPSNELNGQTSCQIMVTAAKQFTGYFVPGADYIGMVSFAGTTNVASAPSTNFQTVLGYSNSSGNSSGLIDNITCFGGTNTSSAMAIAWDMNYETALPGALNVVVLMTDGNPTASTFSAISSDGYNVLSTSQSNCTDSTGRAIKNGGSMVTNPRNWIASDQATNGSAPYVVNLSYGSGASYFANISGPVATLYADTSNWYGGMYWFSPNSNYSNIESIMLPSSEASGCAFPNTTSATPDYAFIPANDIWGNSTTGYQSLPDGNVTVSGIPGSRIQITQNNMVAAHHNTTDNAATFVRTAHGTAGANLIYVIGLGGNVDGVDSTLLQRVANDPNPCSNCSPALSALTTVQTSQPIGKYVYSPDVSSLEQAFATIASEILRISR
jgi:Flp pilus assembly protein TadG